WTGPPRSATHAPTGRRTSGCCSATCAVTPGSRSRIATSSADMRGMRVIWPNSARGKSCNGRGSDRDGWDLALERAGVADRGRDGRQRRGAAGRGADPSRGRARHRRGGRGAGRAQRGVLVLETRAMPTDEVAAWVGQKAGLTPSQLTFVVAPTASLAGGVQIAARILETGLHKMDTLGFDVNRVVSGVGTAPLP